MTSSADIDALFDKYRQLEELVFDIPSNEKKQKLGALKQEIEGSIKALDEEHGYLVSRDIKNIQEFLLATLRSKSKSAGKQILKPAIINPKSLSRHASRSNTPDEKPDSDSSHHKKSSISSSESSDNEVKSTESHVTRAAILYWIGHYYKISDRILEAEQYLIKAVKLDPNLVNGWNVLGQIYHKKEELFAAKCCYECALEYKANTLSYILLSKILRSPKLAKNPEEFTKNAVESLRIAKEALRHSKSSGGIKDGELWFSLGNAYLTVFARQIQNAHSTYTTTSEEKKDENSQESKDNSSMAKKSEESMESASDRTNLLKNEHLDKCLNAYKYAHSKCTINPHTFHPDLYFNRASAYSHYEQYEDALNDLVQARKYGDAFVDAKQQYEILLQKCVKLHKLVTTKGGAKMVKRINAWKPQIKQLATRVTKFITTRKHFDLVSYDKLDVGTNGGRVIVIKFLQVISKQDLPYHCLVMDGNGKVFILSLYVVGNIASHIFNLCSQNTVQASSLVSICNPVVKEVNIAVGSKHIEFRTVSFAHLEDIAVGGKTFSVPG